MFFVPSWELKYFLHKFYIGVCLSQVKVLPRQEAKGFGWPNIYYGWHQEK